MKIIDNWLGKMLGALCVCVALAACVQNADDEPQYDTVTVVDNLVIDENSVPIFPKKAALTTDTARRFSLDLPLNVRWKNC